MGCRRGQCGQQFASSGRFAPSHHFFFLQSWKFLEKISGPHAQLSVLHSCRVTFPSYRRLFYEVRRSGGRGAPRAPTLCLGFMGLRWQRAVSVALLRAARGANRGRGAVAGRRAADRAATEDGSFARVSQSPRAPCASRSFPPPSRLLPLSPCFAAVSRVVSVASGRGQREVRDVFAAGRATPICPPPPQRQRCRPPPPYSTLARLRCWRRLRRRCAALAPPPVAQHRPAAARRARSASILVRTLAAPQATLGEYWYSSLPERAAAFQGGAAASAWLALSDAIILSSRSERRLAHPPPTRSSPPTQ